MENINIVKKYTKPKFLDLDFNELEEGDLIETKERLHDFAIKLVIDKAKKYKKRLVPLFDVFGNVNFYCYSSNFIYKGRYRPSDAIAEKIKKDVLDMIENGDEIYASSPKLQNHSGANIKFVLDDMVSEGIFKKEHKHVGGRGRPKYVYTFNI